MLNKNIETEILDALNYFLAREYDGEEKASLKEAFDTEWLISIAYTEYEDEDEFHPYYAIQVSYDLENQRYVYDLGTDDGLKTLYEPCLVEEFMNDLRYAQFEDFINIDYATEE